MGDWQGLDQRLRAALGLSVPAIAISFRAEGAEPVAAAFSKEMPEPAKDGRTGRVAAGCVFWMEGALATFSTVAADHAKPI